MNKSNLSKVLPETWPVFVAATKKKEKKNEKIARLEREVEELKAEIREIKHKELMKDLKPFCRNVD